MFRMIARALALLVLGVGTAAAAELAAPAGRPLLTVSGEIGVTNGEGGARFDRAMLEAMPQATVQTETPWTEGKVSFTGVLLADVLDAVKAGGTGTLAAIALNDYKVELPASDARAHRVLVAMAMNGKPMSVREKGPLWIIYPLSDESALQTQETYSKMIWQLARIEVR
ncbi:MAG: molybdopterin-dependent oxidoreductase [Pseudomonadota bacterium]|nr:molybdopterin-dependent oxidoreductase [Pseudomonadota bacterium]